MSSSYFSLGFLSRDSESLRGERAGHNFIREGHFKFAGAVKTRYVLLSRLGQSGAHSHLNLLPHFAMWAFDRFFVSRDSSNALQRGDQFGAGRGFGHESVRP